MFPIPMPETEKSIQNVAQGVMARLKAGDTRFGFTQDE